MAAPTYATDLTLIDAADAVGNYTALGGGQAGLNNETDYFVETPQCVSKNGFTASTRGFILNTGTRTVAAGDAIFAWGKQNNRNLMDTIANGGKQLLVGDDISNYDQFYVDGSNAQGGDLAGWKNYAVDPTQTPSATTGTPTTANRVGFLWKILGSGSLKGAPNAMDISYHGRELTCIDGDLGNGYATFDGAAVFDAGNTRRWGLLTPVLGGYSQHGAFVMGTTATAVDFRDSFRNINVLDDLFVPAGFNEFEIRNASSNVEWTNINITQLVETGNSVATAPFVLTLDVGTFVGIGCIFTGGSTTAFSATGSATLCQWISMGAITAPGSTLNGSSILTPTVAADTSALIWNVATDPDGKLDDMIFSRGANAHHGIELGLSSPLTVTFNGLDATGFNATNGSNDSFFDVKRTTGTVTINNLNPTGTFSYKTAGATVVIQSPVVHTVSNLRTGDRVIWIRVSDGVELENKVESSGVATYAYNYTVDTPVYVQVLSGDNLRKNTVTDITLGNADAGFPAVQAVDNFYFNP